MIHLLRLAVSMAVVAFVLIGCKQTPSEDDGHDHAPGETHAESERIQNKPDVHAEDKPHEGHEGHEDHEDHEDHAGHEDEAEGIIRLDQHELGEFGIRMKTAGPGTLNQTASLAGEIVLNPDRIAHVVARAGGIGAEVLHTIGDRVEAGETLAILESPELAESKAEYLARTARAALALTDLNRAENIHTNTIRLLQIIAGNPDVDMLRSEISGLDIGANRGELISTYAELRASAAIYEREKILFKRGNSSESEYILAESNYKKAVAGFQAVRDDLAFANRRGREAARRAKMVADVSLQAAERRLHALGLDESEVNQVENEPDSQFARYEIRAPIPGRIIERHLVRGESIESGKQIFVIADLSSVWGQLTLYQRDLASVREGMVVRVLGAHNLGRADAIIEYISPILDEQTRTTTARILLDNHDGAWRPGMFIRAELNTSTHEATILVPRSALQEIDHETIIFVKTGEGLEPRKVQVGRTDHESAEILVGLQPGERYVASGGLALKVELNKAALEHAGHAH